MTTRHSDPLRIWITGAGTGIGKAAAVALGASHRLVLSGRRNNLLMCVRDSIPNPAAHLVAPCDVSDEHSVQECWNHISSEWNGIDVLVACAGVAAFKPLLTLSVEDFDRQIGVNLRGVFLTSRCALPGMVERAFGQIIVVNSIASVSAFPGCTGYGASKAGALALSRSLRNEVRSQGVKVHDVLLGATETDIWPTASRELNAHRMMLPDDAAQVICSLIATVDNPRMHIEEIVVRPQHGDL